MAIDLGSAPKQKEIMSGPIPKKSMVKVKLEIRKPKKADPQDESVTVYKSELKGLDLEFTVVSGTFEGLRMWENWFLPPAMQTIKLTKGQEGACNGGFSKCRAVIESARALDPEDPAANRHIDSWFDLHGLEIPVKIGIDKPKPGDIYINNNISKILTIADEEYNEVMAGGEIITDEPIPDIPQGTTTTQTGTKPTWGNGQVPANEAASHTETDKPPETKKTNTPAWAQ
jgi:hypothetical protein